MGVKERLVELLDIIIQPGQKTLGDIADHLIENGITTDQKLEKGQWKWINLHGDGFETLCCSECGYTEGREYYNFCPSCGKLMAPYQKEITNDKQK